MIASESYAVTCGGCADVQPMMCLHRVLLYSTPAPAGKNGLLMENDDITRTGYPTHDTTKNVDLDYAAALTAIDRDRRPCGMLP